MSLHSTLVWQLPIIEQKIYTHEGRSWERQRPLDKPHDDDDDDDDDNDVDSRWSSTTRRAACQAGSKVRLLSLLYGSVSEQMSWRCATYRVSRRRLQLNYVRIPRDMSAMQSDAAAEARCPRCTGRAASPLHSYVQYQMCCIIQLIFNGHFPGQSDQQWFCLYSLLPVFRY